MSDWVIALLCAPIIGSFLGVLIRRLPAGEPIAITRSRCDACDHALGAADLVPLLSYVAQKGKCRYCGAPIGFFHPATELAAVTVALWAASIDSGPSLWADCVLGWTLLALAWIDFQHMVLPDLLTLPLILAGLAFAWVVDRPHIAEHAAGAAIGWLLFAALVHGYRALRGRDGLGEGDAKLLAASGAWVTWLGLGPVMLVAALLGLGLGLVGLLSSGKMKAATPIPFGPPLAMATWLVWLYGPTG